MYELLEQLERLIEKWENAPYTGDLTKAVKSVCAKDLREIIGYAEGKDPHAKKYVPLYTPTDDDIPF